MDLSPDLIEKIYAAIDAANARDPNQEEDNGQAAPKEWLYGRRMSAELARYAPEASAALRIAARGQHIRRWEIPRDRYPRDRAGYHRWRTELQRRHAALLRDLLLEHGVDPALVERVEHLVQKKNLRQDKDVQTLEDVICLVFLRYYAVPFAAQHPPEKVIEILSKTLNKMSDSGRAAIDGLALPEQLLEMIKRAKPD